MWPESEIDLLTASAGGSESVEPLSALAGLLGVLLFSLLLSRLGALALQRFGAVDLPGERRSHQLPTPRGGGVGVVLAWSLWLFLIGAAAGGPWGVMAGAVLAMGLLGLWDDLRDRSALLRLAVQLAISALAALAAVATLAPTDPGGASLALGGWRVAPGLLAGTLITIVLVAATNFFNFMDGIDGMAAGQALFAGLLLGALAGAAGDAPLALAALGLAAAAAGFLPWNFPRARVFLGDVGSTAMGFGIALLGLLGAARGTWDLLLPVLVMSVFLTDAIATLLLRMGRRERWYTAHREHSYQRLTDRGWPHHRVTLTYLAVNTFLVLPTVWIARGSGAVQAMACIALGTLLFGLWMSARRP